MTVTARFTGSLNIGGASIGIDISRTDDSVERASIALPAGKAGTLTTRTDANTGVITLASGHGITISDTVAVFFTAGVQYNCDVTASAATTISIDLGIGTDLPSATSAVVVGVQQSDALPLTGDNLKLLLVKSSNRVLVDFRSSFPASLLTYDIAAGEGRLWYSSNDVTNPLASDVVATVHSANGETTAVNLEIAVLKTTN